MEIPRGWGGLIGRTIRGGGVWIFSVTTHLMEKVLPHLSALMRFVLSGEIIIAWSADIEATSSPCRQLVLSVFSNEGDQSSSTILEIIWSEPTLHF